MLGWVCRGDHAKSAALAVGAEAGVASGETAEEVLPRLPQSRVGRGRGWRAEEVPGLGEKACTTAIGLKTEMSDADEAVWQDVQEEALDEV